MRRRERIVAAWMVLGVGVPAAGVLYATNWLYGLVAGALSVVVGLVGLVGANRYWWRSLGYERTDERFGEPVYRLGVDGRGVEVWQGGVTGSPGSGGHTQFRATAPLAAATDVGTLEIHDPEWGMGRDRTLSFTTGEAAFDDRFLLRGDESSAERLLTPAVRRALLELPSLYQVAISDEAVTLEVRATLGVFSTDTVERYAEGTAAIAAAVEQSVGAARTVSSDGPR